MGAPGAAPVPTTMSGQRSRSCRDPHSSVDPDWRHGPQSALPPGRAARKRTIHHLFGCRVRERIGAGRVKRGEPAGAGNVVGSYSGAVPGRVGDPVRRPDDRRGAAQAFQQYRGGTLREGSGGKPSTPGIVARPWGRRTARGHGGWPTPRRHCAEARRRVPVAAGPRAGAGLRVRSRRSMPRWRRPRLCRRGSAPGPVPIAWGTLPSADRTRDCRAAAARRGRLSRPDARMPGSPECSPLSTSPCSGDAGVG